KRGMELRFEVGDVKRGHCLGGGLNELNAAIRKLGLQLIQYAGSELAVWARRKNESQHARLALILIQPDVLVGAGLNAERHGLARKLWSGVTEGRCPSTRANGKHHRKCQNSVDCGSSHPFVHVPFSRRPSSHAGWGSF